MSGLQSEHLSLLLGSGLTHAVHRMGTGAALPGMNAVTFKTLNDEIAHEAGRTSEAAGRATGNFEDQIRAANELLRGLEIQAAAKEADSEEQKQVADLRSDLKDILKSFAKSILQGEESLAKAEAKEREGASSRRSTWTATASRRRRP